MMVRNDHPLFSGFYSSDRFCGHYDMGRISVTFFVSCSVCISAKKLREMRVQ